MKRSFALVFISLLLMAAQPAILLAIPGSFTVNTFSDTRDVNPGNTGCADSNGDCSLRAAIMEWNALDNTKSGLAGIINLPAGTYTLSRVNLEASDTSDAADDDLDVTANITIVGAGVLETIIDANDLFRAFEVQSGGSLTLQNLTVTGGDASTSNIYPLGGGALVYGTLNLDAVVIRDNSADAGGGLFCWSGGTVIGDRVAISGNGAVAGNGGGIYIADTNDTGVTLSRSLIDNNTASSSGGGIYNDGSSVNSTGGQLTFTNVTVSRNFAEANGGGGGGVYLQPGSRTYMINTTITANRNAFSTSGAGLFAGGAPSFAFLNTLVARNTNASGTNNCYQISDGNLMERSGYNLSDDGSCGFSSDNGSLPSTNPLLEATLTAPAALNGVGTYLLSTGSPAIDAGDPDYEPMGFEDVFGTSRPQDGDGDSFFRNDIGAHEFQFVPGESAPGAPNAPTLLAPENGAALAGTSVVFTWKRSSDPDGGEVDYRLTLGTSPTLDAGDEVEYFCDKDGIEFLVSGFGGAALLFAGLGWSGRDRRRILLVLLGTALLTSVMLAGCGSGSGSGSSSTATTTSFGVDSLQPGTTYYWSVTAKDDQDEVSLDSEIRSFTTPGTI